MFSIALSTWKFCLIHKRTFMEQGTEKFAKIVMDEKQLNGKNRFVADGLATKRECQMLIALAKRYAVQGDGYYGNISPHTDMEIFEGVTLTRTAFLIYFSLLDAKYLEVYLRVTERAKRFLQTYLNLQQTLYFTYTHLVCRSALPSKYLPISILEFK